MAVEKATLAGGCFWCLETLYRELRGVEQVVSGYSGGTVPNPTYEQVCSGETGHAEVVQLTFDPSVISYEDVLRAFFAMHDPTTPNRQGPDEGTQYRSAIFYHSPAQEKAARKLIAELEQEKLFDSPIVTELNPFTAFYPAEAYHQDYYRKNPNQAYCRAIISPKLAKFRQEFFSKLKQ